MSREVAILLEKLPAYRGEKVLLSNQQEAFDIIREIMKMHKQSIPHYDAIAAEHWKGTPIETAKHLFLFARRNLPYQEESTGTQTVKEPQAILAERLKFGNDCKHYSNYIVGVGEGLARLGYPVKCFYRFASYDRNKRTPGHVFAVMVIDGKEYWIDPVPQIGGFNSRAIAPYYFIDKIAPMSNNKSIGSLYSVGSVRPNTINVFMNPRTGTHHQHQVHQGGDWLTHFYGGDQMGKAKKRRKGLHIKLKPGKFFKKIALAPNRNAFLLYLKLNLFHTGSKIYKKMQESPAFKKKFLETWTKIGGNTNKLNTALTQAKNVWNKHHKAHPILSAQEQTNVKSRTESGRKVSGEIILTGNSVGVAVVAIPAVISAAAPIIAIFTNLLKSFGISHAGKEDVKEAEDKTIDDHNEATAEKGDGKKDITETGDVDHGNGVITKVSETADGKQALSYEVKDKQPEGEEATPAGSTADSSAGIMLSKVTDFVSSHKVYFVGGAAVIAAAIIVPKLLKHKRGRK